MNEDYSDSEDFSPKLPADEKIGRAYYTSRNIRWFGTKGELAVVPIGLVEETVGNIFYDDKIEGLEDMIRSLDNDYYELEAPEGTPITIGLQDIIEDQIDIANDEFEVNNEGSRDIEDAYSMGNDELDEYLGTEEIDDYYELDSIYLADDLVGTMKEYKGAIAQNLITPQALEKKLKQALEGDEHFEYMEEEEIERVKGDIETYLELEQRLADAIPQSDVGTYRIALRDGNHRFNVARNLGEKYIAIDLVDNSGTQGLEVSNYEYLTPARQIYRQDMEENTNRTTISEEYPPDWDMDQYLTIWSKEGNKKANEYAKKHLKKLGCGEARCVFDVDGKKVLKLAKDFKYGTKQNYYEIENIYNNEDNPLTPELFDIDDHYRWHEMEYIRPFKTEDEFFEVMGFNDFDVELIYNAIYKEKMGVDELGGDVLDVYEELKDNEYIWDFIDLAIGSKMAKSNILPDFLRYDHWGLNKQGDPKVMDLGFTYEYARNRF